MKIIPTIENNPICVESRDKFVENNYGELKSAILQFIEIVGTATCNEIENGLHARHQSVSCLLRFMTAEKYGNPILEICGTRINNETMRKVTVYRIREVANEQRNFAF
jgi:pheromone shutdown protein TraB